LAFGSPETFAKVVSYAHKADMTVSGDLLFNLPGPSPNAMRDDLRRAIELGLDQICLYHLVLFRGLGTVWSRNSELLDAIPSNQQACQNWIALRKQLLTAGYVQTTLTNFERQSVHETQRRFSYENFSFQPNRYDMVGFGPSGISFAANKSFTRGWKTTNSESTIEYLQRMKKTGTPCERFFIYDEYDLRVFYLIRRLAALAIEPHDYERQFGVLVSRDFAQEFVALSDARLIGTRKKAIVPTAKGMFYADAIASLFARKSKRAFPGKQKARRLFSTRPTRKSEVALHGERKTHRLSRVNETHDHSNSGGHM